MLNFNHGLIILSSRPTLLRHKLQSKMAHFASLDSPSIKLYDINTALHKAFILCISIFLMKDFVVIENY